MTPAPVRRRRLEDLYVLYRQVDFDDGMGESITVFLRKLSPVDADKVTLRANAARARALSLKNRPDSDEYQALRGDILDMEQEALVAVLEGDERNRRRGPIEARIAHEGGWMEDNYLQGIYDAWEGGLKDRFIDEPEDSEAKRVYDEMQRYLAACDEVVDAEMNEYRDDLARQPIEALQNQVIDLMIKIQADLTWLVENRKSQIWLATREDDKKTPHFSEREQVDHLEDNVFQHLVNEYQALVVEVDEAKKSRLTQPSSPSVGEPDKEETDSSGQKE